MDVALRPGDSLHVQVLDDGEGLSVLRDFLARIDADVLDSAVNAALQINGGTYGELTLLVLRGWASGEVEFGTY